MTGVGSSPVTLLKSSPVSGPGLRVVSAVSAGWAETSARLPGPEDSGRLYGPLGSPQFPELYPWIENLFGCSCLYHSAYEQGDPWSTLASRVHDAAAHEPGF